MHKRNQGLFTAGSGHRYQYLYRKIPDERLVPYAILRKITRRLEAEDVSTIGYFQRATALNT